MKFIEKVDTLPEKIRDFFVSDKVRLELEKACIFFGIDTTRIQPLSISIGLIFIGEVSLKDLPSIISKNLLLNESASYGVAWEINKRIFNRFPDYFQDSDLLLDQWAKKKSAPLLSEAEAQKKLLEIEPWIAEQEKEKEELKKRELEYLLKIPLAEALKTFPELGEQIITVQAIKLKSFPEPVRPSLKNWLADYNMVLGFEAHDAIDRSGYLFQNENARRLDAEERQKLAYLLKSLDEKTPIMVNKATKRIIFPEYTPAPAPKPAPMTEPRAMESMSRPTSTPRPASISSSHLFRPTSTSKTAIIPAPAPKPAPRSFPNINQPSAPAAKPTLPINRAAQALAQTSFPRTTPLPMVRKAVQTPVAPEPVAPKIDEVDKKDDRVKFSYAQKMPFEKKPEDLHNYAPHSNVRLAPIAKKSTPDERLLSKNVVNLKEQN